MCRQPLLPEGERDRAEGGASGAEDLEEGAGEERVWMRSWAKKLGLPGNLAPAHGWAGWAGAAGHTHLSAGQATRPPGKGVPRTVSRSPEHLSHGSGAVA